MKLTVGSKLISFSLFSGAFGLDLGLERAGFNTVSVLEIDRDCNKTIAINRPHLSECAVPRDIRKISSEQLLQEGGKTLGLNRSLQIGEIDLITGGPPCQPFSTAGKRLSVGDPRGSLFIEFLRLIKEIQPRFFIMENVRGLLSAPIKHRPHKHRGSGYPPLEPEEMPGAALKVILAEIENIGYQVNYRLLQAADYGVPQTRLRVFFLASRDQERLTFPTPSHVKEALQILPQWLTLRDAIKNINDDSPEHSRYSSQRLKYLKLLNAGQNWRCLPEKLQSEAMGGAYKSGGGKVGFYRRLSWKKPSPTVTTSPHQKATDMCHPQELRPLSVRECARIQTFPDDWIFYGSISSKYKQIGNAVPVLLGKAIGNHLYKIIQDKNNILKSTNNCNTSKEIVMNEKKTIKILLKDAGVRKASLLTEKILTLENYLKITEEELSQFQWIDKKGKYILMVKKSEIDNLISKRDLYLKDEKYTEQKKEKLKEVCSWLSSLPLMKDLLKEFLPSRKAGDIAKSIKTIEQIKISSPAFSKNLKKLSAQEKDDIVSLFSQKDSWDYSSIKNLYYQANIFAETISVRAKIRQEKISIHDKDVYKLFKLYLLKNWYLIKSNPDLLIQKSRDLGFIQNENEFDESNMEIAVKILSLEEQYFNIALLLLEEIIKMSDDIPKLALKAISTGNPFLFRSLFLDFKEVEEFAIGGKLNSSLETKYGNLFEKLMSIFGYCQEIYDGGVDVVVGKKAFDIKSGPNVMNKSMVDAFSAKQVLIQDKKILPEINSYQIALGYGKRENLNSFMAKIDSEILTARESWTKITGIDYSPEIVFAIAGLVPKIFGCKSIVSSIIDKNELYGFNKKDDEKFKEIFSDHFDEINIDSATQSKIDKIESLLD